MFEDGFALPAWVKAPETEAEVEGPVLNTGRRDAFEGGDDVIGIHRFAYCSAVPAGRSVHISAPQPCHHASVRSEKRIPIGGLTQFHDIRI